MVIVFLVFRSRAFSSGSYHSPIPAPYLKIATIQVFIQLGFKNIFIWDLIIIMIMIIIIIIIMKIILLLLL